jgi:hypothetical protein
MSEETWTDVPSWPAYLNGELEVDTNTLQRPPDESCFPTIVTLHML